MTLILWPSACERLRAAVLPVYWGNNSARHPLVRVATGTCIWARLKQFDWPTRLTTLEEGSMTPIFTVFKMRRTLVVAGERIGNIQTSSLIPRLIHRLALLLPPLHNGSCIHYRASTRVLPGGI